MEGRSRELGKRVLEEDLSKRVRVFSNDMHEDVRNYFIKRYFDNDEKEM